ncbi:MAG TPA: pyridoxamine 5'-phosphate oxidase family protein [Actinomycetes bacterium]|jgi:nitroimidazol reductase NimA-like FMN-containing flavoprotein (pyridoxamine 5'-phosphate oxidase superfamily)|nr:pyridoxamine 5'-phosphate oxidase family protein [Actinomycetes bacterium]
MRELARGQPACVTVTHLQGVVLARSAFEHSANYESVVAFGRFRPIDDPGERLAALATFTNKLLPGRWDEVRAPSPKELKGTMILAMEIDQAAAKVQHRDPAPNESR